MRVLTLRLDKLTVCCVVVAIVSTVAPQALGLPLYYKTESNATDFDLKHALGTNHRHKRAAFPLDSGPNLLEDSGLLQHGANGTSAKEGEEIRSLRIRRSSDDDDDDYINRHEDYYEGGGASDVKGGRKRWILSTVAFMWLCWLCIACSILRLVAKNLA